MNTYSIICNLVKHTDRMAELLDGQDIYNAMQMNTGLTDNFNKIMTALAQAASEPDAVKNLAGRLEPVMLSIVAAQEDDDYVALADALRDAGKLCRQALEELHYQNVWKEPYDYYADNYAAAGDDIRRMLDEIHAEDEETIPDEYILLETETGEFTLKINDIMSQGKRRSILLHSIYNPNEEAGRLADAYCDGSRPNVVLLGLGMGYVVKAIAERDDIVSLDVFETDCNVIKAAFHYAELAPVLRCGRINIIYDNMLAEFSRAMTANAELIIHRPSLYNIRHNELRKKMEDFFLHDSSVRSQLDRLNGNFRMNMKLQSESAEGVLDKLHGKRVMLIAGGPSLDDMLPALKKWSTEYIVTEYASDGVVSMPLSEYSKSGCGEEYIIMCVGTVLSRLQSCGIKPDYVVMTDAQPNMVNQIEGVDTGDITLIQLSTLYYEVARRWQGKRFMAFQQGYGPAEQYAGEHGMMLFNTGGSVATLALDICLKAGCAGLVCMGLDLAYTDGKRHAGDAECSFGGCSDNILRKVKSVKGEMIYSPKNLDNYRLWIERRLKARCEEEHNIELINISRGAFIEGMDNILPEQEME